VSLLPLLLLPLNTQVPVEDLARRLDSLLNGLNTLLDRDHALQYVYKHRHLRRLLADPEAAVDNLRERHDAYVDVLGVPPPVSLLAASESSHIATLTPSAFRRKLEHFAARYAPGGWCAIVLVVVLDLLLMAVGCLWDVCMLLLCACSCGRTRTPSAQVACACCGMQVGG
jgi:hypothetical protein